MKTGKMPAKKKTQSTVADRRMSARKSKSSTKQKAPGQRTWGNQKRQNTDKEIWHAPLSLQLKKDKTRYHQQQVKRKRLKSGEVGSGNASAEGNRPLQPRNRSNRVNNVDIHLASAVSQSLRNDIARFKAKKHFNAAAFGESLNNVLRFVPPMFVNQHLPDEVASFRTYLSKFSRGAGNSVVAFLQWFEWASYEASKGKHFQSTSARHGKEAGLGEDGDGEATAGSARSKEALSETKLLMTQTLMGRKHIQALLQMCLRHNADRRREGQHAFINHLCATLSSEGVCCDTLEELRATAHQSIIYALSRLLLGMASENMASIILHCHALYLVLTQTPIKSAVVLSLLEEEFTLTARMKAVQLRLSDRKNRSIAHEEDDADTELVDPDDLNDPTKGERNQRMTAVVFALVAVVAAQPSELGIEDARRLASFLAFCYVEQKATRVLSANALFLHATHNPLIYDDEEAMTWASYAFFYYPKLEYFRPEGIQFLLRLMGREPTPSLRCFPVTIEQYTRMDPLESAVLDQLANALFRKEQVTALHPMVHPVWDDFLELILLRSAQGESMKEHISAFVHTVIVPYRRGSADAPRRSLFQVLATRLGELAVRSEDAEQRTELLHLVSKNAGYGKRTVVKPTPLAELKGFSVTALDAKVDDLLRQYCLITDKSIAARTNRTWVLRELRNCLCVPLGSGVQCTYADKAAKALLELGFYPPRPSKDTASQNRCIYLFAELFSFTAKRALTRPRCNVSGLFLIRALLTAEEGGRCRYTTALQHASFRKARNRIVEALEKNAQRSVLFYESRDMEVLLTFLFLILSVDDASNSETAMLTSSLVPDLVHFYLHGTLETLDVLYDVLMGLMTRASSPMHVMPLMTYVRRVAIGFMLKFGCYIRSKFTVDIFLTPLREAYHTDSRELARQAKNKRGNNADQDGDGPDMSDRDSDDDDNFSESSSNASIKETVVGENNADNVSTATEVSSDSSGEDDEEDGKSDTLTQEDDAVQEEASEDVEMDVAAILSDEGGDDDDASLEAEEIPTQRYLDVLKGMVGNVDLDHVYPVDTTNKEKSDVARVLHVAARVGLMMRSPLVVSIYQVLLAVCRETVKSPDDFIFQTAVSSLEMLLLSKNRYYGYFLPATDLFQLLSDVQSYHRKLTRSLFHGKENAASLKSVAAARRRLTKLKTLALRVLHFVSFLAFKNHAGEDVRLTLSEYYKSIFCDRGWNMRQTLPGLKRDLFHYRQGFAWALLPAVFDKFDEVVALNTPQRTRVFEGCCIMVESMLSRLSRLPSELKMHVSRAIRNFLQSVTLQQVYDMKHTLPFAYLHTIKMVLQYNSRVGLDTEWVSTHVVKEAVESESIQFSAASVRMLSTMERLLGLTSRARETITPAPIKALLQQFDKTGAKKKSEFYSKNKRARAKVLKALLAFRNKDLTDEERAIKRRRHEEKKIEDRLQRQVMRENRSKILTKEEREERRKRFLMAKQERITRNRQRRMRLHEARQRSFEKWREEKLAAAAAAADDSHNLF